MAHYDDDTQKFMDKLAEDEKKSHKGTVARQAIGVMKDLAKDPRKIEGALAKRVLSLATKATVHSLEKNAGDSILGIYNMLNQHFKQEWFEWESETLWKTLEMDFGVHVDDQMKDAVQALTVICKTNFPFEDFHIFEKVGHALSMNPVHFSEIHPLEPYEIAKLCKVLSMIRQGEPFASEVLIYIGSCAKHAGFVFLPEDIFPWGAQAYLDLLENDYQLKMDVEALYSKGITTSSSEPISVQLDRLHTIKQFVDSLA